MKRILAFFLILSILPWCSLCAARAEIHIITPQPMEVLPVKEGNIHVAWDLEGQAGYWLILSTDTYDVLLQGDFSAGTQEADIAVEDVLEENVLYCFCVSSLSNNGTIALFTIIREAGSGTKAASSPQQPSSRQVTGPSRHPVYRLAPDEKDS